MSPSVWQGIIGKAATLCIAREIQRDGARKKISKNYPDRVDLTHSRTTQ
jgi:hypothetical protein